LVRGLLGGGELPILGKLHLKRTVKARGGVFGKYYLPIQIVKEVENEIDVSKHDTTNPNQFGSFQFSSSKCQKQTTNPKESPQTRTKSGRMLSHSGQLNIANLQMDYTLKPSF